MDRFTVASNSTFSAPSAVPAKRRRFGSDATSANPGMGQYTADENEDQAENHGKGPAHGLGDMASRSGVSKRRNPRPDRSTIQPDSTNQAFPPGPNLGWNQPFVQPGFQNGLGNAQPFPQTQAPIDQNGVNPFNYPMWNNFFMPAVNPAFNPAGNQFPLMSPPLFFPTQPLQNTAGMPLPNSPIPVGDALIGDGPPIEAQKARSPTPPPPAPKPSAKYLKQASGPPKRRPTPQSLLVILDINGTLIHRKHRKLPPSFTERPGLNEFIDALQQKYYVMIWSSCHANTVNAICERIFPGVRRRALVAEWGRDKLNLTKSQMKKKVQVYKTLDTVWRQKTIQDTYSESTQPLQHLPSKNKKKKQGAKSAAVPFPGHRWDQSNTVLIDDSFLKASSEPYNIIEIPEFTNSPAPTIDESRVFPEVLRKLNILAHHNDVSRVLRHWSLNPDDLALTVPLPRLPPKSASHPSQEQIQTQIQTHLPPRPPPPQPPSSISLSAPAPASHPPGSHVQTQTQTHIPQPRPSAAPASISLLTPTPARVASEGLGPGEGELKEEKETPAEPQPQFAPQTEFQAEFHAQSHRQTKARAEKQRKRERLAAHKIATWASKERWRQINLDARKAGGGDEDEDEGGRRLRSRSRSRSRSSSSSSSSSHSRSRSGFQSQAQSKARSQPKNKAKGWARARSKSKSKPKSKPPSPRRLESPKSENYLLDRLEESLN